ncbi:MAG: Fmu (Sun) domain-containing protein [Flavisolibacter sp.]
MRAHSYINSAKIILDQYDGGIPLASWLKQFFREHKKYGSRDRKLISQLCYSFYRLGRAFPQQPFEERILQALFLVSETSNPVLEALRPLWNERVTLPLEEKLEGLGVSEAVMDLFPLAADISPAIETRSFILSFLRQPLLYLRVRPGKKEAVWRKLRAAGLAFETTVNEGIALANSTPVHEVLELNKEAVIQDENSQKIGEVFMEMKALLPGPAFTVWDCCAASGGKSLLLHDYFPNARITVSDKRETILINLKKRFDQAGVRVIRSLVADLSQPLPPSLRQQLFDVVICDAPCTGSGTWSRTPEQMYFFEKKRIDEYAALQKQIALQAAKQVREGGFFLYITCSVFKKENEEVVSFLQEQAGLHCLNARYFKGYDKKADTLFAALFTL